MSNFTVAFEDLRWPELPPVTFAIEADIASLAVDTAIIQFRRTFPRENLANYIAICELTQHAQEFRELSI